MGRAANVRGSGIRHTLPYVRPFSGLWLVVSVAAVVVASTTTYLFFADSLHGGLHVAFLVLLAGKTVLLILALAALAVFTTHRLAGPWIALRRTCRRVADGDLDARLAFRRGDAYLEGVEQEFEAMMVALRARLQPTAEGVSEPPLQAG